MKPEVSAAVEELYEALDPALTQGDEDRGWATLHLCAAIVEGNLAFVHTLVTEDEAPGWQILLDPDRCPAVALPYLAQFVGAKLEPGMTEEQQRDAIRAPEGFGRGTPAAIEAFVKRYLTGTKTVLLTERYTGNPWRLRIETIEGETPDPDLVEAAVRAEQKPIGIVLFFNTRAPWTWAELLAQAETYPDWEAVREAFATWLELRTHEP